MHERIADGAFHRLAELRPRHQERVDVHPVRVERQAGRLHLLVVDRHQHQVDVGLRPDRIVRQAAAEDGRQDRPVLFHLATRSSSASVNFRGMDPVKRFPLTANTSGIIA